MMNDYKMNIIQVVKQYPAIWASKCSISSNSKHDRERAWRAIFPQVISGYDQLSVEDRALPELTVKKKWTSIRDTFQRKFKRREEQERIGGELSSDDIRESETDKALAFLKKSLTNKIQPQAKLSIPLVDEETIPNFRNFIPSSSRSHVDNAIDIFNSSEYPEERPSTSVEEVNPSIDLRTEDSSISDPEDSHKTTYSTDNQFTTAEEHLDANNKVTTGDNRAREEAMSPSDHRRSRKRPFEEEEEPENSEEKLLQDFLNGHVFKMVKRFDGKQKLEFQSKVIKLISDIQYPETNNQ
uniref:MADF domain-containing protein n=1 Tax=Graphocephala atropunctata TaxID=36148 RepID=A0A1B6KGM2_9HEMI